AVDAPRRGAPRIRQTRRILRGGPDPVVALGDLHGHRHRDRIHREPGRGGLVTLKDSGWVLSLSVFHQPEIIGQPPGTSVWWGYGLYPERNGDFVRKPMDQCSGAELLEETLRHLRFDRHLVAIMASSICVPCNLPMAAPEPRRQAARGSREVDQSRTHRPVR